VGGQDVLTRRAIAVASVLVLAWAGRAGAQDDEPDGVLRLPERLTVGVADDLLGQLSPDGRTLYFVSNRNTTHQLFAQSMADGRAKQLFDDDADVTWPRISPDGKHLLYISFGERASGQLCIRALPDGDGRRCLEDASAAQQAEWIDASHVALVSRQSIEGDLRVLDVTVGSALSARPLLARNLTSPTVSPDGRWLVYVPVARTVESVGPAFAAHAAQRFEAVRLDGAGAPAPIEIALPGQAGQPVFSRDGRALYFVQFFSDTNHDGVIDANDYGVLFRAPISFTGGAPALGPAEQLTDTSWDCQYPAPAADRLIATCSQDRSLDVYALPLDGEVSAEWSAPQIAAALDTAGSRVERQILASRALDRETTTSGRRLAMLGLAMLHLDLEQYRAAEFYAERVAELHDPLTAGLSHPLLALVAQRRAERNRDRGRFGDPFGPQARQRLDELHPKPTASAVAVALTHVVRSEIADSIGDKTQAQTELEAVALDATTPPPVVEAYYQRADALYRSLDDREGLVTACKSLAASTALSPDDRLRYARAAVRAMLRGLPRGEADARLSRERSAAEVDSELAFALDLAREVLAIQGASPVGLVPPTVSDSLMALYARQSRPDRRAALVTDAVRSAEERGADGIVEAIAQKDIEDVQRGTRERRSAERLYRRVMTGRAYRLAAARQFADARATFDAIAQQTGSYEAVVGSIDMRLKATDRPADIAAAYDKPGTPPALSHFANAYLLARQLPKLEGEQHAKAAADALATLRSSWAELKGQRIAQALDGALLHEEYLRTGDLASAEKANVHYLVALELVRTNPRFRAMILGELGLLHDEVGNYRIALGYLTGRDKLPYADNSEGLAVLLARARALLHVGREEEAAVAAEEAIAMTGRAPALAPYRVLALDRAALDNLAAGRFARALELYDAEIPALDAAGGPLAQHNRFVARVARAAAAVGAKRPERALGDLAVVEQELANAAFVATLRWPHATTDHVVRSYRLIATGLRASASHELGRLDEEAKAIAERRAILDERFAKTQRTEYERAEMLTEAQLALNASDRHDPGAAGSWVSRAVASADDLRARANGVTDRDQLDVLWLAADLAVSTGSPAGSPFVRDLHQHLDAAATEIAARREPALRAYERWFEIYGTLTSPAAAAADVAAPAAAPRDAAR
jgi:tetratricopeptide (TPR) repeat protein